MVQRLDHFKFKWNLVNISMWNMETPLHSPHFEVCSTSVCKWKLELWPQMHGEQKALSVRLRMYSRTSDAVLVNFKLSAVNQLKQFWLVEKETHLFKNEGTWISSSTPTLEKVRGKLQNNIRLEEEIWTIECELLYVDGFRYGHLPYVSPGWQAVKELSADLQKCFGDETYKDVNLSAKGRTFTAHRAIIFARDPSFRPSLGDPKWLEKTKGEDQQQLDTVYIVLTEDEDYILQAALKFAYTGYIEAFETGTPPPIGLYEYAEGARIDSLKGNLELCSSVGQTVYKVSVTQLFFNTENKNVLTTDEFTFNLSKLTGSKQFGWQLNGKWVAQKSTSNRRTLSLYLKPLEQSQVLKVKLVLSIIRSDRTYSHTRCVIDRIVVGSCLVVDSVIDEAMLRYELTHLKPDDVFNIYCHVTCSTGECETSVKTHNAVIYAPQAESNLICLCNDMRELFKGGFFADAFVVTKEEVHKVHRFLLSARSAYFASQFRQKLSVDKKAIPAISVDNISEETLTFMYCGRINLNHDLAIALLAESESFEIPSLKKFCREFFKSELNVRNVCDILKLAERSVDPDLKMAAIEFANETNSSVTDLEGFDDLRKEFPGLAEEIENSLLYR